MYYANDKNGMRINVVAAEDGEVYTCQHVAVH